MSKQLASQKTYKLYKSLLETTFKVAYKRYIDQIYQIDQPDQKNCVQRLVDLVSCSLGKNSHSTTKAAVK